MGISRGYSYNFNRRLQKCLFGITGPNWEAELDIILTGLGKAVPVYFQPPESVKMEFPCIVYHHYNLDIKNANNINYNYTMGYQVKVIDIDPDSPIPDRLMEEFQYCRWNNTYIVGQLNHTILIIYDRN